VHSLMLTGERVGGVELVAGERIEAPLVLSALSRRRTLALVPTAAAGLGAAQQVSLPSPGAVGILFGLNRASDAGAALMPAGSRCIVADRPEVYAAALGAARQGGASDEPVLELASPPVEPSADAMASRLQLYIRAWPAPPDPPPGLDGTVRIVTAVLERLAPGFTSRIASCDVLPPDENEPASVARLTAGADARIATAIPGLLLCGSAAEPADVVSCRAARQAARMAIALRTRREPR